MALIVSAVTAYPCTTFVLRQNNTIVFGRNLDWITGTGLIMTNPRNLEKTALADASEKKLTWVSKFGSVTFNQVGRELPYGGINEAGLVVEHMTLDETVYPPKDRRYAIGACQWIQFQLDNYSTVEEVVHSDTLLRIADATSRFHFLVCDRFGHVAVIEFLKGKMVLHTGNTLPVEALANSTYEKSAGVFGGGGETGSDLSLYNFCTAANSIRRDRAVPGDSTIDYAFHTLQAVSQGLATKWSIVYDITNMKIHFKVFETPTIVGAQKIFTKDRERTAVKVVDVKAFDFDCLHASRVLDLNAQVEGSVNGSFTDYTTAINKKFIATAFEFFKGWGVGIALGEAEVDGLARYPESFRCVPAR
jgi:hypothetical protein